MASAPLFAGVELGGTKCICILGRGPGDIVDRRRLPTTDVAATLGAIEAVLDGWRDGPGFAALGIASFGPVDLDLASPGWGHVLKTPKPGWSGADVGARLRRRYAVPTGFDTDVDGAALAEGRWGAARGLDDFTYVTVGTGVGGGVIVRGQPVHGIGHAEIGHMRIARMPGDDWPGNCPYHGDCVEGLASGSAIAARTGQAAETLAIDHPVWASVADALGQMLHNLVLVAAPRRILIGGGVMASGKLLPRVRAVFAASLAEYGTAPGSGGALDDYVRAPGLGPDSGALGALALAANAHAASR